MNERELISALVDGELPPAERDALLSRMAQDATLADTWRRYHIQHAAVQHEAVATDLSARVMAALNDEPVVLAPRALRREQPTTAHWFTRGWVRVAGGMAIAAGVTFAVTSVLQTANVTEPGHDLTALYQAADHPQVLVAPASTAVPSSVPQVALNDSDRENAYMLAHAEYSERGLDDGIMPFARVAGQSEDN